MQNRAAIIAGGVAAAAAVAYGLLRRRPAPLPRGAAPEEPAGPDPRAESLREKLAASRELAAAREAFEEAEMPVDEAVAAESGEDVPVDEAVAAEANEAVQDRRSALHERGRAAADEMRRGTGNGE